MRTEFKTIKNHTISTGHTELIKTGKNSYSLKHYKTEILRITNGKVKKLIPASKTSYSAIVQALKFLKISKVDVKDMCMKLNNKSVEDLQQEWRLELIRK